MIDISFVFTEDTPGYWEGSNLDPDKYCPAPIEKEENTIEWELED